MSSLDELRSEAYENAKLFTEKVKKWHDKKSLKREFNVGDKYCCIGPVSDFLHENSYQNGKGLLLLKKFIIQVPSKLIHWMEINRQ